MVAHSVFGGLVLSSTHQALPQTQLEATVPHSSGTVYIVTTVEGLCKSTECLIYVSPKKNG